MSKRSPLFRIETESRCSQSSCNFPAAHFDRPGSDQLVSEFFRNVVMVTLECASVHLITISKLNEFFYRLITNEVTPSATVKPPPRLIDQNHGPKVIPLLPRARDPPCGPALKLSLPLLRPLRLRMLLE